MPVLPFVGRERELETLASALDRGSHAILEGPYGMGRSALLRQAAARAGSAWRFAVADFDLEPAAIDAQLWDSLVGRAPGRRRPARQAAVRAAVLRCPLIEPQRRHVLALENIARLSPRKLALIQRYAASGRFRLAAIVERFLPADDRLRLHACIEPVCRIVLGPLPPAAARQFFRRLAADHDLPWSAEMIASLASSTHGYPLLMRQQARRELARRAADTQLSLRL